MNGGHSRSHLVSNNHIAIELNGIVSSVYLGVMWRCAGSEGGRSRCGGDAGHHVYVMWTSHTCHEGLMWICVGGKGGSSRCGGDAGHHAPTAAAIHLLRSAAGVSASLCAHTHTTTALIFASASEHTFDSIVFHRHSCREVPLVSCWQHVKGGPFAVASPHRRPCLSAKKGAILALKPSVMIHQD